MHNTFNDVIIIRILPNKKDLITKCSTLKKNEIVLATIV